jgi:hypothetical protein
MPMNSKYLYWILCVITYSTIDTNAVYVKRRKPPPSTKETDPNKQVGRKTCKVNGNYDKNFTQVMYDETEAVNMGPLTSSSSLPLRNRDPRLNDKCRAVYGSFGNVRGTLSVTTIEDILAKKLKEDSPRHKKCTMLHPYGSFIFPSHKNGGDGILYVEMPKVASTTLKYWMHDLFCVHPKFGDDTIHSKYGKEIPVFPSTQLSFVIVREPLQRFLSGYQTVRMRALLKASKLTRSFQDEVKRFEDFVQTIVTRGALVMDKNQPGSCAWCHTLSQMWFIEMYPLPISFVLHLETLEEELMELGKRIPIVLPNTPLGSENTMDDRKSEGVLSPEELMRSSPASIKQVLEYLKQDYVCLDYPLPHML